MMRSNISFCNNCGDGTVTEVWFPQRTDSETLPTLGGAWPVFTVDAAAMVQLKVRERKSEFPLHWCLWPLEFYLRHGDRNG